MDELLKKGFREIEHTADWRLEVWAPELADLFIEAASGMISLLGLEFEEQAERFWKEFELQAVDEESLLVKFLSEILFHLEDEQIAYTIVDIEINESTLTAKLHGQKIVSQKKEIKAVTYHQLDIQQINGQFSVQIVFDV